MTAAIVLVFLFVLTTAPQSPPPAIAEIAPAAVEQIKEAPAEQSSDFGSGEGGTGGKPAPGGKGSGTGEGAAAGPSGEPTVAPDAVKEVATTFRCVGSPLRQIEDPQSPPCVPYFDPKTDNGGATSRGVTEDEIVVVKAQGSLSAAQAYVDFFNARFQMYGRRIKLVSGGGSAECSPEEQRAVADRVDKQMKPFASFFFYGCGGAVYNREMARRQIVTVANDAYLTEAEMAQGRPFIWQYAMARERLFAHYGEWMCARLQDRLAAHAGLRDATDMTTEKRRFGLVVSGFDILPYQVDPSPLKQELGVCGGKFDEEIELTPDLQTQFSTTPAKLKEARVTTVICLCVWSTYTNLVNAATSQNYQPEWLVGTYGGLDMQAYFNNGFPPPQRQHMLGLTSQPRQQPVDKSPAVWASDESTGSRFREQKSEDSGGTRWEHDLTYRTLLLIASGIQMAGPNLTPETFEAGLHKTLFPNPDHPIKAGKVGFQGGSHAMTLDVAEYYFDNFSRSPWREDGPGALCYVRGGARIRSGGFVRDGDPFYKTCDSGAP